MIRITVRVVIAVLVVATVARPAGAITDNWNNNVGGSYTLGSNWTDAANPSSHVVPGAADTAVFNRNLNVAYNVTFPGGPILNPPTRDVLQLKVGTNNVSFADSLTINQSPGRLRVDPTNTIAEGATIVGDTAGQVAVLNTTLSNFSTSSAIIGNAAGATGTLNVNGGTFNVTGSQALADELVIGDHGTGTLNVTGGAHANVPNGTAYLGRNTDSTGTANVSGAGSTWTVFGLNLGVNGTGTLTVAAGGTVVNSGGALIDGMVTVTGPASTWNCDFGVTLGSIVSGSLTIENGGQVTSGVGASLAVSPFSSGQVIVDGPGSTWNDGGGVVVGRQGFAHLGITNGGQVTTNGPAQIGEDIGAEGSAGIIGAGSTWTISGSLMVGNAGDGILQLAEGTVSVSGPLTIKSLGTLYGVGNISAAMNNAGVVDPGQVAFPGALDVDGSYTQAAAGKLKIELGGTMPGTEFDQLLVNGPVSLNGTLQVSILDPYLPMKGDTYNILDWTGSLTGTFSSLQLPALYGGLGWNLSQLYLSGTLSVGGVLGDYNGNGVVDAADYTVWRNALGRTGSGLAADGNGDKSITQADYDVWKMHFGETAGSGAGASTNAAVPEPATLWLLVAGVLTLCSRRRPAVP